MVKIGETEVPDTVVVALVSLAAGVIGTFLAAILKFRNDLKAKYDEDLRKMRMGAYIELWKLTEAFAKYSPPGPITHLRLKDISFDMRNWYFKTGGWLLSDNCRETYFALQRKIKETTEGPNKKDHDLLQPPALDELQSKSSDLRTNICKDIGTRKEPEFD